MRVLITSYKFEESEKELAFQDLEKLHTIRGRILHLSTIIEMVLKENISEEDYHKYKEECKLEKIKSGEVACLYALSPN